MALHTGGQGAIRGVTHANDSFLWPPFNIMHHENQRHPFTAHLPRDIGMTEAAIARGEGQARHGAAVEARARRLHGRGASVRIEPDEPLPPDFVAEALARIVAPLRCGQWGLLKETIDQIAGEWELRAKGLPAGSEGQRHAIPVSALNLTPRQRELCEEQQITTVGKLLEEFPQAFVGLPNCGPESVKALAKALVAVGALNNRGALVKCQDWEAAMREAGPYRGNLIYVSG